MKIKLSYILFTAYIILVSLIFKKPQLTSLILFVIVVILTNLFIKNKINDKLENFLFILIAFIPFPYVMSIFLIYLPFMVFGFLLTKRSFIKNYILGFAVSLLPTILIYTTTNYFDLQLNIFTILAFFYTPIIIAIFTVLKKKKTLEFLYLDFKEYVIILSALLAVIFVTVNIVNDHSLFISNGTHQYSKFNLIVKSANTYGKFPIYDPASQSGEAQFLFEAPLMFSHIAFANILLYFIPSILFYNAYSSFILLISTLSLSLLLRSIFDNFQEKLENNLLNLAVIALGSISIGLNFYFVQLLESFKQFFGFPINYLIFSLILEKSFNPKEMVLILYMILLTFVIHVPHGVGIVLIASSLLLLIMIKLYFSREIIHVKNWLLRNKLKALGIALILISLPAFYIMPTIVYKDFLEEKPKIVLKNFLLGPYEYSYSFIYDWPLSLRYPDINRNDDKKAGPFITIFGLISIVILLGFLRSEIPHNLKLFSGAYLIHFFISSIIINIPMIGHLEYTYRTAQPYLIILFVMWICAFIILIKQKYVKLLLTLVLLVGFIHMLPFVKKNIENVHTEEFVSGRFFEREINFVKSLPQDGRIITYGLFANAVDTGMATLTDRYFSRYHLTEVARSRAIYSKIHDSHSFGQSDTLLAMSGTELSNYLRLGGYKYIFLDLRHPIGDFVAKKLYPNSTYPIYQNQYLVFFVVNNTNYAEKVSVLRNVDENVYKEKDGYKYVTLSTHYDFDNNFPFSKNVTEPEKLDFKRISPTEVEIYGNFNDNDWVTFKEAYFLRWKAYINGQEVPVLASNHDLILINTIKGNTITLKYQVLPIEKIFGSLSLISAFILLFMFIFSI